MSDARTEHRPRASIVVGSYNRVGHLCELLGRFLEQDCQDFEVIVVEQSTRASVDERRRLGDFASDPRIRVYHRPPLGGAGARNEGCRFARADIIIAFDDDDLPATRSWLSAMLRNFDDPQCLAVSGRHILEGGPNPPYRNMAKARRLVLSYSWLMWQRCYARVDVRSEKIQNLMGGNSAFRRSVFERVGLWDTFTRCENENSFCFRLLKRMQPGEYLVFDPQATMLRRLGIAGGMEKRERSVFSFGWSLFEYFHKVIGYYHRWRFLGLYPVYFAHYVTVVAEWIWNDSAETRKKPVRAALTIGSFCAVLPVVWTLWLGRLAFELARFGPTRRETEFLPYPDDAADSPR